ncbi:TIR domain-containing protein [Streptomyces chartreusis]
MIMSTNHFANELAKQQLIRISQRYADVRESATRHKCFISYHGADAQEVLRFVENFEDAFIPRVIGITDSDPAIDSTDSDYIMERIRERYLRDSTVTIVMTGACTWSRRYIDWEIYSSLRRGSINRINGLMAIQLPSTNATGAKLPSRLADNVNGGDGYARYWKYPSSVDSLRSLIEMAFQARQNKSHLIDNSRARKERNSSCP